MPLRDLQTNPAVAQRAAVPESKTVASEVAEDTVAVAVAHAKCTQLHARVAVKRQRYRLSPGKGVLFTATTAIAKNAPVVVVVAEGSRLPA